MITKTKPIPTIAVMPETMLTLSEKIEKWVYEYCGSLEENYKLRYPNSHSDKEFKMQLGRKYWKVMQWDYWDSDNTKFSESVHAFVDKNTGEVYKPASYKSPAKIVRYDMRLIKDRAKLHNPNFTDWAGGYLYLRG